MTLPLINDILASKYNFSSPKKVRKSPKKVRKSPK